MWRTGLVLSLLCSALPACASDAAPEPEAGIETPGAFIAVDEGKGALTLLRTIDTLSLQHDTLLIVTIYDVDPTTWEEAREMSKSHDLPIRLEIQFASRGPLIAHPHRVVWYRTLNEDEMGRLP